jgi:hypothetical protein
MKLRRRSRPAVDPDQARLVAGLYHTFLTDREVCQRLGDRQRRGLLTAEDREEAQFRACMTSYQCRVTFEAIANLHLTDTLPEGWLPVTATNALARLTYALVALSEPDPEPEALLSPEELNGLTAQYGLEDWVARWERMAARGEAGMA